MAFSYKKQFFGTSVEKNKTEFNVKWPFTVTQGDVLWGQWKGNEGLNNSPTI